MKRIYLSGPMTGLRDFNFPAFNEAALRLRSMGFVCINPAEICQEDHTDWHQCMRNDLKALLDCDTLALLDNWENSAGAHLEIQVAHRVGIKIVMVRDLLMRESA